MTESVNPERPDEEEAEQMVKPEDVPTGNFHDDDEGEESDGDEQPPT